MIVGGGDGSLNAAASGLLGTKLPLDVLPLGTGNDFARTIGLPLDLAEAVNVIASGKTSPVDVGMAIDYPFFNVASVGFSADLAASLTENAKKRWEKSTATLLHQFRNELSTTPAAYRQAFGSLSRTRRDIAASVIAFPAFRQ